MDRLKFLWDIYQEQPASQECSLIDGKTIDYENMSPEEKFKRLSNPKTLKDFGLSVTLMEMKTFKEGRAIVLALRREERARKIMSRRAARIGSSIGEQFHKMILEIALARSK